MPNFVRKSLFRHVFGQPYKREKQFESISISKASTENNMCEANPKFVAIITEARGGGSFLVLPLEQFGRVDPNAPKVCGHTQAVLDIAWCPHNDNIIASCSEDTTIKIWYIPDEGLTEPLTEAEQTLEGHQRKVLHIEWNPAAENILLSFAQDEPLFVWDVATGEVLTTVEHPSAVVCASWSPIGDLIGTSCKDKKFRIIDARSGDIKQEGDGFEGGKPQKIKMLKDNKAFTTGMSRQAQRQYKLFNTNDMSKPLVSEQVDNGSNTFQIFYDEDVNMIYLAAKGDCKLLYYEVDDQAPYVHYLALHQPKEASKGLGWMPKRGLNLNEHEVARFYRLKDKGGCEPCSMIVPRKSELFQRDIYPPCASLDPAMTAEEWIGGASKPRPTIDMEQFFKGGSAVSKSGSSRLVRRTGPTVAGKQDDAKPSGSSSRLGQKSESTTSSAESKASGDIHTTPPQDPTDVDDLVGTLQPLSNGDPTPKIPSQNRVPPPVDASAFRSKSPSPHPPNDGLSAPLATPDLLSLLETFKGLRSSVTDHDARLSYLEDLTTEQKKQIEDLIKEVEKLKATVKEQEERISALEAQGQVNGN